MSLTKRPNSVNWYSEFTISGKKFVKSTKTKNRTLASQIDQQYYKEALEKMKLGGNTISLKEALLKYQASKRDNEKYRKQIGGIMAWIEDNMDTSIPMTKVDSRFLDDFVNKRFEMGLMPSTVKANMFVFTGTINLMRKLNYDVCTVVKPEIKIKNKKTRVITKEEETRLLAELSTTKIGPGLGEIKLKQRKELHDLVVVLLDTACRFQEIAKIKWDQIDFENRTIDVWRTKTSTASLLPMSDRVYDILQARDKSCAWVFPNKKLDGPRSYTIEALHQACKRAGIEGVTWHTSRHTAATRLSQAGLSLSQLQTVTGHSSVVSLQIYQHLTTNDTIDKVRNILNTN